MRYRLTEAADADIADVLRFTARRFGPVQRRRYAQMIEQAIAMVAEAPTRPGSRNRDELGKGVRSLHLELAVRRRGAGSHALYYSVGPLEDGNDGVIILRLLHERMDPTRHFGPED